MLKVDYYDLPNGDKPVEKFINKLEPKLKAKVVGMIAVLKERGYMLREPYTKSMGGGVFELRIEYAGDIARIFFFFIIGGKAVLTNGIIKKKDKTPSGALALARKYKKEYEGRLING